ncbi:(Fe-S)-binding protein [Belliella aquatica]|uniref:Glycolate oxidase n=1 Tax=Belliella aquatica TaxID=1323734 RepID=A0ABQ1LNM9_9BACT|nr:(Fe-S)-binding protein [Belliella aquatica]MCH7404340.1 (Fe-S)-binding protein [Belliella aquatica]GGC27216.1 glycolate oxidase [Belliella aquatica]
MSLNKKVGLFIPCYVDQFYPKVAIATLELLRKLGCEVSYPMNQTCCGQPMANAGYERDTVATTQHFLDTFESYDYIVCPSGSCVHHVRDHAPSIEGKENNQKDIQQRVYELTEFITDILKITDIKGSYPHRVGFHSSCHGQRGLRLASSSELNQPVFNKAKELLANFEGLEWVELSRKDECCGFGGTFAVTEEALSIQMGKDRLQDHISKEAEIIIGGDMSCIMHLSGIASRNKQSIQFKHIAEVLNEAML